MLVDVPKPKAGSGQDKVGGAELCHTDLALMHRKKALHALALGIERIGLVSLRFPLTVALVVIAPRSPPGSVSQESRSTIRSANCSVRTRRSSSNMKR